MKSRATYAYHSAQYNPNLNTLQAHGTTQRRSVSSSDAILTTLCDGPSMEINPYHLIALGMGAGALAGLLGIGGAIVIIPILVLVFGMTQQQAQGTTMAFLTLPVGILGAYVYYERGLVNVSWALLLTAGFVVGSFVGARIATTLSNELLQKIFGVVLIVLGIRMAFFSR
jgi:uncharacterized protein